jgi:hypothetical protein
MDERHACTVQNPVAMPSSTLICDGLAPPEVRHSKWCYLRLNPDCRDSAMGP